MKDNKSCKEFKVQVRLSEKEKELLNLKSKKEKKTKSEILRRNIYE